MNKPKFIGFEWRAGLQQDTYFLYRVFEETNISGRGWTSRRYVGYVKRFTHEGHDQWNAYLDHVLHSEGRNYQFVCSAKTLEEIKTAFEVIARLEQ
jgi:hypothetical protein